MESSDVFNRDNDSVETYQVMEEFVKNGEVRSLGLSRLNISQMQQIMSTAEIRPVVNEIEYHPYINQTDLLNYCKSNGFAIIGYAPYSQTKKLFRGLKRILEDEQIDKTPEQLFLRYQVSVF